MVFLANQVIRHQMGQIRTSPEWQPRVGGKACGTSPTQRLLPAPTSVLIPPAALASQRRSSSPSYFSQQAGWERSSSTLSILTSYDPASLCQRNLLLGPCAQHLVQKSSIKPQILSHIGNLLCSPHKSLWTLAHSVEHSFITPGLCF